jgi:hypothetical protein
MLNEDELKDAALLVFANKQDQPGAKGAGEISEALKLAELRDRNWSIVACSAVDGRGVDEGMDWLVVSHLLSVGGRKEKLIRHSKLYSKIHKEELTGKNPACIITQLPLGNKHTHYLNVSRANDWKGSGVVLPYEAHMLMIC